jgi:mRNA-degrading endonuclease RelE of RelBE toxin-antitoxin system
MSYSISIKKRAAKSLANLPERDYLRIRDTIRELGENPRPSDRLFFDFCKRSNEIDIVST